MISAIGIAWLVMSDELISVAEVSSGMVDSGDDAVKSLIYFPFQGFGLLAKVRIILDMWKNYMDNSIIVTNFTERKSKEIKQPKFSKNTMKILRSLPCLVVAGLCVSGLAASGADKVPTEADMGAYLMVYHSDSTHSIHMALSRDGYTFTSLNEGAPVISGDTIASQHGVRDPHIYRDPRDGSFLLCATDLHIYAQELGLRDSLWERPKEQFGWGNNKGIVLMKSRNLIDWSHTEVKFDSIYPDEWSDIGCAWAPESFYDDTCGEMMIALTMRHGTQPDRLRYIYVDSTYTRPLSAPAQLFEYPPSDCSVIDGSLAKVDSMYILSYCVHDREGGGPGIKMARSSVSPRGPWTYIDRWVDFEPRSCEAPNLWKRIGSHEWVLVYDIFSIKPHNLGFVSTTDFENFNYLKHFNRGVMKTTNFTSPKHPAVIHLTPAEADALEGYWNVNPRRYEKPSSHSTI